MSSVNIPPSPLRVGLLTYGLDRPGTGISRYVLELAHALVAGHPEIALVLLQPFAGSIPQLEGIPRVRLRGTRLLPAMMTLGPAEIAFAARRHRLDVVHDPIGIAPFPMPRRGCGWARVVTIHDMVPFVYPETHARLTNLLFRRYMPFTVKNVDRVITDSEASKRDIVRFYGLEPEQVTRVYLGANARFRPQPEERVAAVLDRYHIARPYVLAVGALQPRKNIETALEAFAALKRVGMPHQLVLVGPKAWKTEGIFARLDQVRIGEHVRFTGFVGDDDLPALYSGAACFVFPSLYEGFGLPPLEAMACGAPVVASNASSIPEVVGDAGLLVDPRDLPSLTEALERVLTQPKIAEQLRTAGLSRARSFSYAEAADAHGSIYREVAGRSRPRG